MSESGAVSAATSRDDTLDVARAVAMIGVVVLNYHTYLNGLEAWTPLSPSIWQRLYNPSTGFFTTRFAALFVLVAGIGVSLMTRRSRESSNSSLLRADRLRLARRGTLLLLVGYFLEWIWPGTILFYYGAYFIVAASIFAAPTRRVLGVGIAAAVAAATIAWWRADQVLDLNFTSWLAPPKIDSPRNFLIRMFVSYTHPLFPWLLFFAVGIVLGRHMQNFAKFRAKMMLWSALIVASTYTATHLLSPSPARDPHETMIAKLLSTDPYDRGLAYSIVTLATALFAFGALSLLVSSIGGSAPVQMLSRAGQMSLTIYIAHIFFFNIVVHRLRWVGATGLDTAVVLALVFYAAAIPLSATWRKYAGRGPAERMYRAFGG